VLAGQADQAIDEVRALQGTEPDHILLNEEYLRRLVSSLRNTWGLTEEAMPVIRFRVELYPSSVGAQVMLAEGHIDVGDYPAAIEVYSRLLERNPDDRRIRSRLEWLRRQ
jgi:predicted Zn-dependent protease